MERRSAIRYFHYCSDPPTKCLVKKQHLDRYRQLLGICNSRVTPRKDDYTSLQIKKSQLDSLVQLALYKESRVKTEPTGADFERMIRTNEFVKRGMASFNKTNQEDVQDHSSKIISSKITSSKLFNMQESVNSVYVDRISRQCIGEDISTIVKPTTQARSRASTVYKQLNELAIKRRSRSRQSKLGRQKPWSAAVRRMSFDASGNSLGEINI